MLKLQPLSITAESPQPDAKYSYLVRFQTESGEVDYRFFVDTSDIPILISDDEFLDLTLGDQAADLVLRSISALHNARHFEYGSSKESTTAEIRSTDSSKRASA